MDCFVVPDDDLAELWEIDENLIRSELQDSQRATAHARREAIMVSPGLVTRHGGAREQTAGSATCSYSKQAATTLGVSERTVRRDLARGKKIAPEVLADVSGSALDKGVVLDELAATPREDQRARLAEITLRREGAERVRAGADKANRSIQRAIGTSDADELAKSLGTRFDRDEMQNLLIARLRKFRSTADLRDALERLA